MRHRHAICASIAVALNLALYAAPSCAAQYRGIDSMNRNAALMKAGDYRGAMIGFLDMVLRDPGDSDARECLKLAAEGALKLERRTIAAERSSLLAGSIQAKRELYALDAARKKRTSAWKKIFLKARSLASGPNTLREAVLMHERLLLVTPVYLNNRAQFLSMNAEIKERLYKTIKGKYPNIAPERNSINERDLAMYFFSQESIEDVDARYLQTGQTQDILDKSSSMRLLERKILKHYDSLEKGWALYIKGRYADAAASFSDVLGFDPSNEEALFYMACAKLKLSQPVARPAALPVRLKQDKR